MIVDSTSSPSTLLSDSNDSNDPSDKVLLNWLEAQSTDSHKVQVATGGYL